MERPAYFECRCGFYHLLGATNACGNDAASFISEELDDKHGEGKWDEIFPAEEETEQVPAAVRRKNYDRIMAITAETDIDGKKLESGCKVRVFFPYYDPENDWLMGMDTTGRRCSYIEGRLVEIADHKPTYATEAYPHYAIDLDREVTPTITRTRNDFESGEAQPRAAHGRIWIVVNGTPVKGVRVNDKGIFVEDPEALEWKTFGVTRI